MGRSKSWTTALEAISGDVRMDAKAMLNYFEKLHTWLKEDNDKHNRLRGWKTPSGFAANNRLVTVFIDDVFLVLIVGGIMRCNSRKDRKHDSVTQFESVERQLNCRVFTRKQVGKKKLPNFLIWYKTDLFILYFFVFHSHCFLPAVIL